MRPRVELAVDADVVLRHPAGVETALEGLTTRCARDLGKTFDGVNGLFDVVAHEARDSVVDHLGYRSATECDRRSTARHGFYHHEAKWLGPIDRKHQRERVP